MRHDSNIVQRANKPIIGEGARTLPVPANAVAGTAESIDADLKAVSDISPGQTVNIGFVNPAAGGAPIYLRDGVTAGAVAATAGAGIEIASGEKLNVGYRVGSGWLMQNAHTVYLAVFVG